MHLEKNVFESTIDVLLDIKGKTKDGLKSWTDLVNLGIRPDFHPGPPQNGKVDIPGAACNLTQDERMTFLKFLKSLVSMKDPEANKETSYRGRR